MTYSDAYIAALEAVYEWAVDRELPSKFIAEVELSKIQAEEDDE